MYKKADLFVTPFSSQLIWLPPWKTPKGSQQ